MAKKGRGSRRKRSSRQKPAAARSGDPAKQVEEATAKLKPHQRRKVLRVLDGTSTDELRKRQQAHDAGGFTREERRRSRQRKEEAARLAARRMAKAVNDARDRD